MLTFRNKNGFALQPDVFLKRFNDLWNGALCDSDASCIGGSFDVDIKETDNSYVLTAEIPGINKDNISVELENGNLSISFSKQEDKNEEGDNYHVRERKYGKYSRSFKLPSSDGSVDATIKDGILTVEVKKLASSKKKQIEVKSV